MRTRWILGNWKQNQSRAEAADFGRAFGAAVSELSLPGALEIGLAPSFLALDAVREALGDADLRLLSQDCAAQESGAFTGEVGPAMLREAGVEVTLVGHSERRALYGEGDALLAAKVRCALDGGLTVVLCVGETLEERDAGQQESVVFSQLSGALSQVKAEEMDARIVVAYEPVWAIGTGRTATPEQADAMHGAIRAHLAEHYGDAGSGRSILYGGSVKPGNASALIACSDIDGFLVGGASLDPDAFLAIVRAALE